MSLQMLVLQLELQEVGQLFLLRHLFLLILVGREVGMALILEQKWACQEQSHKRKRDMNGQKLIFLFDQPSKKAIT
jgi:hypothetical protein